MNILNAIKVYPSSWNEVESRNFTSEELSGVEEAFVHEGTYGLSVCLILKSGGKGFIPLDQNSVMTVGEPVDLSLCQLVTLKRGDETIYRVRA